MPKFILEVDLGIPDLTGDGELVTIAACLLEASGVKLTCLMAAEAVLDLPGVTGSEGSDFSKFGLLGLRVKVGIDVGFFN